MEKGGVITLVTKNFLADTVKGMCDPETKNKAPTNICKILTNCEEKAWSKPGVKFAIIQFILHSIHQWYMDSIEEFGK
jgi:hypothetical protein